MISGIYKITNKVNGKVYIGQSVDIERRWKEHRQRPFNSNSQQYNSPLYRAIRKHGLDNFIFQVIEEGLPSELNDKEIYWINYYNSYLNGYNLTLGGDTGEHNAKLTQEQINKIKNYLIHTTKTQQEIANEFGICQKMVFLIDKGQAWLDPKLSYPLRNKSQIADLRKKRYFCIDCGIEISNGAERCFECARKALRTTARPSREELKKLIRTTAFTKIAEQYGVSDNAIRKWCIAEHLPNKKTEIKKYSDIEWAQI